MPQLYTHRPYPERLSIANKVSIELRPSIAAERAAFGTREHELKMDAGCPGLMPEPVFT